MDITASLYDAKKVFEREQIKDLLSCYIPLYAPNYFEKETNAIRS